MSEAIRGARAEVRRETQALQEALGMTDTPADRAMAVLAKERARQASIGYDDHPEDVEPTELEYDQADLLLAALTAAGLRIEAEGQAVECDDCTAPATHHYCTKHYLIERQGNPDD